MNYAGHEENAAIVLASVFTGAGVNQANFAQHSATKSGENTNYALISELESTTKTLYAILAKVHSKQREGPFGSSAILRYYSGGNSLKLFKGKE